jgi:hypothetical protein
MIDIFKPPQAKLDCPANLREALTEHRPLLIKSTDQIKPSIILLDGFGFVLHMTYLSFTNGYVE